MTDMSTEVVPAFARAKTQTRAVRVLSFLAKWSSQRPVLAILFVSVLTVVINCHPILFCGKSYVSPACVDSLIYGWWPPAPGMAPNTRFAQPPESDTCAMMWWDAPMGFVQSRSLLEHGEIPLWNRYSHCGDTLIGQAVSMLGDPLQSIVILGRGSALAWDAKFLVAKTLFCFGFGLVIRRLLGCGPMGLLYAALGAYCGVYFRIANHPVFFVLAYAPWILLSAMELLEARSAGYVRWGVLWLLANIGCFNGGHVEVAVDLIGGLNLAALVNALASQADGRQARRVLGIMGIATLLFLGMTAPVWISFLVGLKDSFTVHAAIHVFQQPLRSLPGAFDEAFFWGVSKPVAQGTSLLVLAGCVLSARRWRQLKEQSFFWVNLGAIFLWGGVVFGWVPAGVLERIPLLNRVGHTDMDFSYLLAIHLTIQSAYGFKCLAGEENLRRTVTDFLWMLAVFAGALLEYVCARTSQPISLSYFLYAGLGAMGAPLLFAYLKSRYGHVSALGWIGIFLLGFFPQHRFGLYTSGDSMLYLRPGPRMVLNPRTEALDRLQADKSAPFRVSAVQYGIGGILSGDYGAIYGLEDIRSCAPVSSGEYVRLIAKFPGMLHDKGWVLGIKDPARAQPLLSALNVKYVLVDPVHRIPAQASFRVVTQSDLLVLENLEVWPRAFFVNQVTRAASTEEFSRQLLANGKQPFASVSEEAIRQHPRLGRLRDAPTLLILPATNYQLRANSTGFDVHVPCPGMVCLLEGQGRDFTVKANQQAKEVLTVNRVFKGVFLEQPGDYHVEFTYRPRHWQLACICFWSSLAGVAVLAVARKVCVARPDSAPQRQAGPMRAENFEHLLSHKP